jgi:hypothetical protein
MGYRLSLIHSSPENMMTKRLPATPGQTGYSTIHADIVALLETSRWIW